MRILLLLSLLLLGGCFKRIPVIDSPRDFVAAEAEYMPQLHQLLRQSHADCVSFRSSAKVSASKGLGSETFRQITLFERPDSLRFDFFDPTRTTLLGLMVLREGRFWFLDKENKRVITGGATPENLERVTSIPLAPEELMDWICGVVPHYVSIDRALVNAPHDRFFLELSLPHFRSMRVLLSRAGDKHLRVDSASLSDTPEETLLVMQYEYAGASQVPSVVSADAVRADFKVKLEFDEPQLNPELSDRARRAFEFSVPPGYRVEDFESGVE